MRLKSCPPLRIATYRSGLSSGTLPTVVPKRMVGGQIAFFWWPSEPLRWRMPDRVAEGGAFLFSLFSLVSYQPQPFNSHCCRLTLNFDHSMQNTVLAS